MFQFPLTFIFKTEVVWDSRRILSLNLGNIAIWTISGSSVCLYGSIRNVYLRRCINGWLSIKSVPHTKVNTGKKCINYISKDNTFKRLTNCNKTITEMTFWVKSYISLASFIWDLFLKVLEMIYTGLISMQWLGAKIATQGYVRFNIQALRNFSH